MAAIQSYPLGTPKSSDLVVGTSIPLPDTNDTPITKSFSVGSIGSNIITDNNVITGGGTLNAVPLFTPDGQTIDDSIITQNVAGNSILISGFLEVNDDTTFYSDATFEGSAEFQLAVKDSSSSTGTSGQVLSSTGTETLWITPSTGSLPYTSYTALITQSSTNAPVVETVLEDDPIFGTLTFGRDLAGEYYVTSSLTPFSATTTACIINGGFNVRANFAWIVTSSSRIDFLSAEPPNTYSDNNFSKGLFEIRIYS